MRNPDKGLCNELHSKLIKAQLRRFPFNLLIDMYANFSHLKIPRGISFLRLLRHMSLSGLTTQTSFFVILWFNMRSQKTKKLDFPVKLGNDIVFYWIPRFNRGMTILSSRSSTSIDFLPPRSLTNINPSFIIPLWRLRLKRKRRSYIRLTPLPLSSESLTLCIMRFGR
jgi:hypothetical protein